MVPTNPKSASETVPALLQHLMLGGLLVLPYLSYLGMAMLAVFLGICLRHWGREIWQLLYRRGWVWLALALGVNVALSRFPTESALQSMNLWPFFIFHAAIAVALRHLPQPITTLHRWALGLLLATIPISLRAIVEFYLKAPSSVARWSGNPWFDWLYLQPNYGFRADSVFGHPNVLANYLVIIFGLGLGLCAYYFEKQRRQALSLVVYGATALALAGVFCSGSRNGLMVAGLQLLCFGWLMRRHRYLVLVGLGSLVALGLGAMVWGIGGRSILEAFATASFRFDVWGASMDMIKQRPWLGHGLGSFRLNYQPYTIPVYDWVAHSHNLVLMLITELGIPIAVGFLGVVGWTVAQGLQGLKQTPLPRPQQLVLIAYYLGFAGMVGFSMFDLTFYDARVNVLGWLTLAVLQATPALVQREPNPRLASPSAGQSKDPAPSQP